MMLESDTESQSYKISADKFVEARYFRVSGCMPTWAIVSLAN